MDIELLKRHAATAVKGAAFATAIAVVQELLKDAQVGDRRVVLFTARR